MSRHRLSLTRSYGAALVAFAASLAPVVAVDAATNATPTEGSRMITSNGVSIRVPGTWPVYDLGQQTSRCVRLDVHAVYLGHQGPDASCPARLLGKTEALQIEPLDSSVTQPSSRAKLARSINGHRVRLDPAGDVSHDLVAAIDESRALVTISFGHDQRLADQVLNSLSLAPTVGRSSTLTPAVAMPNSAIGRTLPPAAPDALAAAPSGPFNGPGFDACAAPSTGSMQAWLSSPYRAVGIYIGGALRACPDGNLSASWVTTVTGQGWNLIPTYVGLQAPCNSTLFPNGTIDPSSADAEGVQAADDAVKRAQGFGLGRGTTLFFDMEGYSPTGGSCSSTVMTFLAAWNRELHVNGYVSGVYSSLNSGIADLVVTPSAQPDVVWFALWDLNPTTSDPAIPSGLWLNQRLKQYRGGHDETYAGVTINIDNDHVNATLKATVAVGHSRAGSASWGPGRLDVFVRGADSALWHKSWNGAWSGWESLGGGLTSDPAVVSWGSNRLDIFVRGADNALWHQAWTGSYWSGWESLGGGLSSNPAVVSQGWNRLDVFVRAPDNALWHQAWTGSYWSGWESLGGGLSSDPAAASWGSNRLDVFVRGSDNALWHRSWNGGWSGWESLGGGLTSNPAVASWGSNRLDIFVRAPDNALWHQAWTGSYWSGWESLGGGLSSDPAVVSWGSNRLDVLVQGGDNGLWHRSWAGGWSGWESLGGNLASSPDPISWGQNRLDVFTHGGDNALWHVWWNGSSWNGWESEGGVMS